MRGLRPPLTGLGSQIQNVRHDPFDMILPLVLYSASILLIQALLVNCGEQSSHGAMCIIGYCETNLRKV